MSTLGLSPAVTPRKTTTRSMTCIDRQFLKMLADCDSEINPSSHPAPVQSLHKNLHPRLKSGNIYQDSQRLLELALEYVSQLFNSYKEIDQSSLKIFSQELFREFISQGFTVHGLNPLSPQTRPADEKVEEDGPEKDWIQKSPETFDTQETLHFNSLKVRDIQSRVRRHTVQGSLVRTNSICSVFSRHANEFDDCSSGLILTADDIKKPCWETYHPKSYPLTEDLIESQVPTVFKCFDTLNTGLIGLEKVPDLLQWLFQGIQAPEVSRPDLQYWIFRAGIYHGDNNSYQNSVLPLQIDLSSFKRLLRVMANLEEPTQK